LVVGLELPRDDRGLLARHLHLARVRDLEVLVGLLLCGLDEAPELGDPEVLLPFHDRDRERGTQLVLADRTERPGRAGRALADAPALGREKRQWVPRVLDLGAGHRPPAEPRRRETLLEH